MATNEDAIALLKADHRKVEELFEKFEDAKGESRKRTLVEQICLELLVHTQIEEEIFYPACQDKIEEADTLEEAYVEHDSAKVLIAELMGSKPDADFYDAKVKVLSEMIKHHVKEEEKRSEGLFAQARDAGIDMDEIAGRLKARKQELLKQFKSGGLPVPQTRSYSGHKLVQGAPAHV